jgi:hypothetical protein
MRCMMALLLALTCLIGTGPTARATDPEVWYNPHGPSDILDLWTDDAPWQQAAKKVRVLEIVHWWLDTVTDKQILAMTDFAKRHNMKIDLEIEAITRYTNLCGNGIEGYTAPGDLTRQAGKLKRLNVHVDIMTMDEPVWFGHYDPTPNACRLTTADLAARVASNISGIIDLYPNIQLYEIETVPGVTNFSDWRESISSFHASLTKATGKPVRGIQLDVGWDTPAWQSGIRDMSAFLRQNNMRLGIFEYALSSARSDAEWINQATQHFEYLEGIAGIVPDQAIFTTWSPYPKYNLPETSPGALTWLINRYFRDRALLNAQFVGQGAHGKLTTVDGKPIANAPVNGYVPGADFSKPLPTAVVQGVVPSNAAYGMLAYRLNTECNCHGPNDVLIGVLQYQETQGGTAQASFSLPLTPQNYKGVIVDSELVGGTRVSRVITTATQTFAPNSGFFPVTPGAQYTFTVPATTIGGEGWFGNVFLLWADAGKAGFTRVNVIPDPGKRLMSTATTAIDGSFQLRALPKVAPGSVPVTVEFPGDDTHRSAGWSPIQ